MIKNIAAAVLAMCLVYLGTWFVMWDNPFATIAEWDPIARYGYLFLNLCAISIAAAVVNI